MGIFLVCISALSLVSCCETLYVVIRAGPIARHAVRMLSLCVYDDLYGQIYLKVTSNEFSLKNRWAPFVSNASEMKKMQPEKM